MVFRFCGQFSFRQFKNGFAWIIQPESSLNFEEDTLAFIQDPPIHKKGITSEPYGYCGGSRMINGVVDHFRYAKLPNGTHIFRKTYKMRNEGFPPYPVLGQTLSRIAARFLIQCLESIFLGTGYARPLKEPFSHKVLYVARRSLAARVELFGEPGRQSGSIL